MTEPELAFDSLAGLAGRLRDGSLDPVELVEQLLVRISDLDGKLHSFIRLTPERALAEAQAARSARAAGQDLGPLDGLPCAVKDLFDVQGTPTTAGTRLRDGHRAQVDSAAVERLASRGMSLLGKTHTVQFAFGAVGINHDQGTPLNPWRPTPFAPGGSSSGSGVAVAAGLVPVALGTDTGGSVRIPAALCGIVGLKTTVGRISRAGVYPLSGTLDSVGVLSRTVEDAARVFEALQGMDRRDPTTLIAESPYPIESLRQGVRGLRIAMCETVFFDDVDPEVEASVRATAEVFSSLGAWVDRIEVPEVAEAAADPLRPLLLAVECSAINAEYLDHHLEALDPVIAPRMLEGRKVTAPDYYALLQRRGELVERAQWRLREVDALLVPTTQIPARPLADIDQGFEVYLDHNTRYNRNTGLGNFLNLCGLSVPCGFTRLGLPIGLMIYARPFREDLALRVAYAYERATDWHTRRPDLLRTLERKERV
jgi:aspartyl-tRNA(Asn)/glutamyl-tRNA(Gln) amidotransferase subunit A